MVRKRKKILQAAFAGESQAYNKYGYYASVAKKEGYERSLQTSWKPPRTKKEHAKIWFKALHGGSIPDTVTNLKDAAAGENLNGPICIRNLLKRQIRKVSPELAFKFRAVGAIESIMRTL